MCFNQKGDIFILKGGSLKLVDKFIYFGSSVSSTENDINMWRHWLLSISYRSYGSQTSDEIKRNFYQAAVVSILLYRFTTRTMTKRIAKKLDGNLIRMLRAKLNKYWKHSTRQQLYGHLLLISKTIKIRRIRLVGNCRRRKDELIRDILLWTPSNGCASVIRSIRIYLQLLCTDTGCSLDDLTEAMDDRDKSMKSVLAARHYYYYYYYYY